MSAATHHFLGAVICEEATSIALTADLDALIAKHAATFPSLNLDTELHGSAMMRAEDEPWRSLPLPVRFAIMTEALTFLERSGAGVHILQATRRRYRRQPTSGRCWGASRACFDCRKWSKSAPTKFLDDTP